MRLSLVLLIVALAGCGAKKPAARNPSNAPAAEMKESAGAPAPVQKADAPDKDDPKRSTAKSDPCEGGE